MKCPKCQTEIMSNARFCTKCGCNLAVEMANAAKASKTVPTVSCTKCGAALKPGAKFCVKCGQAVTSDGNQGQEDHTMFLYDGAGEANHSDQTVIINQENVRQGTQVVQGTNPVLDEIVPPNNANRKEANVKSRNQAGSRQNETRQKSQNAGTGLIIAVVVLLLLVAASGAACYMVWNGTISLPAIGGRFARDKEEESSSVDEESESGADMESAAEKADTAELFAEADALFAEGKNQITVDADVLTGMENIRSAMNQFADKAQEAGDPNIAADRIADAFASYVTGVTKRKDIMSAQELSGAIYSQIMSEIRDAETLAEEMTAKGYTVDTASLMTMKDAFQTSYTGQVISKFDEFTQRDAWSRTEAWNLMSGFDGAFDSSNLDDPIRLRYAYALSWWIQKQIETELDNGTITEKGAAIKIGGLIEAMDYNPMMIVYYITCMDKAGEDCTQVSDAYKEIVQHIAETQGILIGDDIEIDRFWYFNDFGTYSVDEKNGVTPENRQWIRDRMSSVEFAK